MIYNDQFFEIEDQVNELIDSLKESTSFYEYCHFRTILEKDDEGQLLKKEFNEKKADFEKIEPYGKYAPDFTEKRRSLRKAKRALDLAPSVANFRLSETQFQSVLDTIVLEVAESITSEIKVETGNPFFETKSGCGGNCHVG
ncbi:MAG TPA: YlbF family regulator [Candidatus Tetragenococcus pullicola]|nr:YlbF family regulator [Candidatus Tetragenococcus pullicola]